MDIYSVANQMKMERKTQQEAGDWLLSLPQFPCVEYFTHVLTYLYTLNHKPYPHLKLSKFK